MPFILLAAVLLYIFLLYVFRAINRSDIVFILLTVRLGRLAKMLEPSKKI